MVNIIQKNSIVDVLTKTKITGSSPAITAVVVATAK
jgi:hypothetical protein